jgi:hypothetical protein
MTAPIAYNNTTTQLPEIPKAMPPPDRAEVLKHFAHGGIRFVMGRHDTAASLFKTLYPTGRHYEGGASHLQAFLATRPGGYPKPGDVVEIPNFNDYIGKASPEALERAVRRLERQEARRCNAHGSRPSASSERLAAAIAPRRAPHTGMPYGLGRFSNTRT